MNLDGENLNVYILNLPKDKKIEILKDNQIRDKYLRAENHYPFVWLVQQLEDYLPYFIDDYYLLKILKNERNIDKINAIMTCESKYAGIVLVNEEAIKFIIDHSVSHCHIGCLDYNFGKALIDYAIKINNSNIINLIWEFNDDIQNKIISSDMIVKLLQFDNDNKSYLFSMRNQAANKLIRYKKFLDVFMNASIDQINRLVVKGFVFPNYLINNNNLIDKYATIFSASKYSYSVDLLLENNYNLFKNIDKKRKKYIKKELTNIASGHLKMLDNFIHLENITINNDIFSYNSLFYLKSLYKRQKNDEINKQLFKFTSAIQFELLISTYFKDIPFNFLANLKVMLNYINRVDKPIINLENLDIYKKLSDFMNLSLDDRLNFINSFKDDFDYSKMFYDDYKTCLNHSINSMNDKIIKLEKDNSLYNKDLSSKLSVDIYELDGEDFYAYVHSTSIYRYDDINVNWYDNQKTISLSLIGSKNINTYHNKSVLFGFYKLNPNNIIHLYYSDSYTVNQYGSKKINQIYTPEDLVINTMKYNEILYNEKYDIIKPDFVICYDEITNLELSIAKELNVPIVKINTSKYHKTEEQENAYINHYINYEEESPILKEVMKCKKY